MQPTWIGTQVSSGPFDDGFRVEVGKYIFIVHDIGQYNWSLRPIIQELSLNLFCLKLLPAIDLKSKNFCDLIVEENYFN